MTHLRPNFPKILGITIVASRRRKLEIRLLVGVLALLTMEAGPWTARLSRPVTQSHMEAAVTARTEHITLDSYGKLPLAFVPNAGQTDPRVRYYAQAGSASFYFTPSEAVFAFIGDDKGLALCLAFVGGNPHAQIEGSTPGAGRVNYMIGSDPAKWHTGLPTYGEIIYRDLWPGIDLAFRGENGELKYEFHVAPSADPGNIRLAYEGAERLSLGPEGELLIHTEFGVLRDTAPVSYQEVAGARVPVGSRYSLAGSSYAIALDAYDPGRPLVIDPSLAYSTFVGGESIAVDSLGNAYVTGGTTSSNFPTTAGAFDTTFNCPCPTINAYVTKLNATGSALVYSTFLGSASGGRGIAVDSDGNAYVTGVTTSSDFPTTGGAYDTTHNGSNDTFVAKLDPTGATLVYSTYLGGGGGELGYSIAVDPTGNAYVAGETTSADFPTTPGAYDTTYNGGSRDVFVTKLDATGSTLLYSTYLGGDNLDRGLDIAVDGVGNAYVVGDTFSGNFSVTPGAFGTTHGGGGDAFVTKLDATGSTLIYSSFLGGSGGEGGQGIAVDAEGNAYVAGVTNSTSFPTTPGAFAIGFSGVWDAFVTKLDAAGEMLVYSTFLGGSGDDNGFDIAIDSTGRAYITGFTTSDTDFPVTTGAFDTTHNGGTRDAFVTKLDATGANLIYSTYLGGSAPDMGLAIAVDALGDAYVTGSTESGNFPTTPGAFNRSTTSIGFVTKFDNQPPSAADDIASTDEDTSVTISVLANDSDADGDPLALSGVTQGANGSGVINPDNTVTYSPAPDFNGTDSFTYTVVDTWGDTATATVTVTVNPVNDAPTANDDAAIVSEDSGPNIIDVLANDFDVDGDTVAITSVTQAAHGTVVNNGTSVSYTPAPNYFGPDAFTYTVSDGQGGSATATVNVTVVNVNDAPVATDDSYSTNANITLLVPAPGVLANDTDFDGDALSAALVTDVSNGTLDLANDGSFTYTPALNFFGEDNFTYQASDGTATSNVVTVRITVIFNLVVFSSTRDGNSEIYSMGIDGAGQTRLTNHPATDIFPAWSPDMTKIAFSSNREGSFEIYVMNADGSSPVRITTDALVDGAMAWSPDGTKIAFSNNRDGNPEIYVINADGTGLVRLTNNRKIDTKPSWSPDGSRIVFSSDRKRSFEIYVMNADGTGLTQLTKNGFTDGEASWSPDGAKIAFSSNRDGNFEIYVMNPDGSGLTRLTNNAAADSEPAWSADGQKIIFTSERDGNAEIYAMNADGSGQTRLTTNSAADTSPD